MPTITFIMMRHADRADDSTDDNESTAIVPSGMDPLLDISWNPPITTHGRWQAYITGVRLSRDYYQNAALGTRLAIISSPAKRCLETAAYFGRGFTNSRDSSHFVVQPAAMLLEPISERYFMQMRFPSPEDGESIHVPDVFLSPILTRNNFYDKSSPEGRFVIPDTRTDPARTVELITSVLIDTIKAIRQGDTQNWVVVFVGHASLHSFADFGLLGTDAESVDHPEKASVSIYQCRLNSVSFEEVTFIRLMSAHPYWRENSNNNNNTDEDDDWEEGSSLFAVPSVTDDTQLESSG